MEHMDNDFPGITPQLAVADAEAATAFYRKAFEADELLRNRDQHGSVMHCELLVNGGRLLLYELPSGDADGRDRQKHPIPPTVTLHLYVADVDTTYHRALTAGATSLLPPQTSSGETAMPRSSTRADIAGLSQQDARIRARKNSPTEPSPGTHPDNRGADNEFRIADSLPASTPSVVYVAAAPERALQPHDRGLGP